MNMKEEISRDAVLDRLDQLTKQIEGISHSLESLRRAALKNKTAMLGNNKELVQMSSDSTQMLGKILLVIVTMLGLSAGIALLRDSGMDITYEGIGIKAPQRTPRSAEIPGRP